MKLIVGTLNVGGLGRPRPPLIPLAGRAPELGQRLEADPVDVLNLQEVFRYAQLRMLRDHLPSYPTSRTGPDRSARPAGWPPSPDCHWAGCGTDPSAASFRRGAG